MEMSIDVATRARRLRLFCVALLLAHVSAGVYLTIMPQGYWHHRSVGIWYRRFLLTGPFYTDDQIRSTPHAHIQYHGIGQEWSASVDCGHERLQEYHAHPWRYSALKLADYDRTILREAAFRARTSVPFDVFWQSPEFLRLQQYTSEQMPANMLADTIRVVYTYSTWQPGDRTERVDTAMDVSFVPAADNGR